jgi:hypothetical protein
MPGVRWAHGCSVECRPLVGTRFHSVGVAHALDRTAQPTVRRVVVHARVPGLHQRHRAYWHRQREHAQWQPHVGDPIEHHAGHLRQHQVRGGCSEDRAVEGGDDHRHPPLQAQLCQFVVDRPMRDAAPRDGDVVAGGKPLGGDIAVEQRMILSRSAQQCRGERVLHLGFLRMLAGSADIQVDPALHHRVVVGIAFGHEPQRAALAPAGGTLPAGSRRSCR